MSMVDSGMPRGPDKPPSLDQPAHTVPERSSLVTRDFDEALASTAGLYDYPMKWRMTGASADFDFRIDGVQLGPLTIGQGTFGTDIDIHVDDLDSSYNILMPMNGIVGARQRDSAVAASARTAALLRPKGGFRLAWPGESRVLSVKIARAALEYEVAGSAGSSIDVPPSLNLSAGLARSWGHMVRLLQREIDDPASLVWRPVMARRWSQLVIGGLAIVMGELLGVEPGRIRPALRPRTVKRALEAMHANPAYPFTVAELAAVAGVGPRILQESFRRHLDTTPLTYLRRLRLANAHQQLRLCDPREVTVADIAFRCGFTHLGRFAGWHRAEYGVAPSEILNDRC
jgi:AraC-like DNA-binding protein